MVISSSGYFVDVFGRLSEIGEVGLLVVDFVVKRLPLKWCGLLRDLSLNVVVKGKGGIVGENRIEGVSPRSAERSARVAALCSGELN